MTIIVFLDKRLKVYPKVLKILIAIGVNLFPFEGLHKALATGVVVWIRRTAHARNYPVLFENTHVFV